MNGQSGKGSRRRPMQCSQEHYASEWERIFGKQKGYEIPCYELKTMVVKKPRSNFKITFPDDPQPVK